MRSLPASRRDRAAARPWSWGVLGLWTATEATGLHMLRTFVGRGGLQDEHLDTIYPAALVANGTLGTAAGVLWVQFLMTGRRDLARAASAQLAVSVVVGTALALPWHQAKRTGRPSPRAGGPEALQYDYVVEISHAGLAWATTIAAGLIAWRGETG